MIRIVLWIIIVVLVISGFYFIVVKKSNQLAAVAFLFAVVAFLIQSMPESFDDLSCVSDTIETTQYQTTYHTEKETEKNTILETEKNDENETETYSSTEAKESKNTEKDSLPIRNNNIITSDSDLIGNFSNASVEKYILRTKYSNSYGVKFYISDVNQSYSVTIMDEKGEILYKYDINEDKITKNPLLEKDVDYTLLVEADEGKPEYKIEVRYPDNDIF